MVSQVVVGVQVVVDVEVLVGTNALGLKILVCVTVAVGSQYKNSNCQ